MIVGRPIAPRAFDIHPHKEIPIIDAFGMFIEKDEGLARRGSDDLMVFAVSKKLVLYLRRVPTVSVHIAIHCDAANPGQSRPPNRNCGPVGRTFINPK